MKVMSRSVSVGLALAAFCCACRDHGAERAQPGSESTAAAPPEVRVTAVVSQELHGEARLPGELHAYQDVAVYPKVQGFVEEIGVDRGSIVKHGDVLARLIAPELTAQRSEADAKARAAQAQKVEAEAKLTADLATYNRLKSAAAEPGVVAGNDLEVAQKIGDADRARVRAWRENEQAALQSVRSLQDIESYLQITAPFDGVITERNVHTGSLVGPATSAPPMLRLRQITPLRLVVAVPETMVAGIAAGAPVQFTVPAFPGEHFSGGLQRVAHALDVKTRTMPVELDVPNGDRRLAPGMYAEVVWPMRRPHPSLFVPAAAVAVTTERTFVVRVRDGVVEWVDVNRGSAMGDRVEIFGELQAGDAVAARGTDELRPGTRVTAVPAS